MESKQDELVAAALGNLMSSGDLPVVEQRPRKRVRVDADDDDEKKQGNPIEQLTNLRRQIEALVQRAEHLSSNLPTNDSTAIYTAYQETKQKLLLELQQLGEIQQSLSQGQLVNTEELNRVKADLQQQITSLGSILAAMEQQIRDVKNVRQSFGVPDVLSPSSDDMANYYGVYVYDLMRQSALDKLRALEQLTPANWPLNVTTKTDVVAQLLTPTIFAVGQKQNQIQTNYLNLLKSVTEQNVVDNEEKKQFEAEQKIVKSRLNQDGIIAKSYRLALQQLTNDVTITKECQKLITKWIKYPIGALTGDILSGISNIRMFENDVLPVQVQQGQQFEIPKEIKNLNIEAITSRLDEEKRWRLIPTDQKEALRNVALQWAEEGKIEQQGTNPKTRLLRMLRGVASKMGLQILEYSPTLDTVLKTAATNWDNERMTFQMQAACREKSSDQKELQRVVRPQVWRTEILQVARGNKEVGGVHGWFLLDKNNSPNKMYGIVHGRDGRVLVDVTSNFELKTTEIGQTQGVPRVTNEHKQATLDITFVCAQRESKVQLGQAEQIDYSIGGKNPNHLGTLLILWMMASLVDSGYYGIMLEVVGSEIASGGEGWSQGAADSKIASYYHRYFRFQRSASLDFFQPDPSLLAFHPEWNAYEATPTDLDEPLKLEIMYRPYPTVADLADMVSRLVYKVQEYYNFR